jgi:methyl-accepting chemotaxis protein
MRNLSIFQRLALILAIVSVAFCGISATQIWSLRQTVRQERQDKLRDMVGSVVRLAKAYDDEVKAGRLTLEQAQNETRQAIRSLRWGDGDYYGVYRFDGLTLVHGNPKNEGVNRLNVTDSQGKRIVADMIEIARQGGGFAEPYVPRAAGGEPLPKITYQAAYVPWEWAVQAGVYTDDIDAAMYRDALWSGGGALVVLLLVGGFAAWVGRGITRPLANLCSVMDRLAGGDVKTVVPFTDHSKEIGRIARAVEVFKSSLVEREHLQNAQEEMRREAEERNRRNMLALADSFQQSVGEVVGGVSSAAAQMRGAAQAMSSAATQTSSRSATVAAAAEQAAANVQTVAAATQEMSASVTEISRQMTRSLEIAGRAVDDTHRTNVTIKGLHESAQKIGDVVQLINGIANQTNLLALNATIEAARAGDAGKGFAVVASEVKTLASQTGRATEEIAGQIGAIQDATNAAVGAIERIGATIDELNQIATSIASAMEEQGAATQEITRNTQEAAKGAGDVTTNLDEICSQVGATGNKAAEVLEAAGDLDRRATVLSTEVDKFLSSVRAA